MPKRQINHVDIIPYARAVVGRVIVAKDLDFFQPPYRDLSYIGHKVVGDAVGVFANKPAFVRAYWVEISQNSRIERGVGDILVFYNPFYKQLSSAVWISRAKKGVFFDRNAFGH